MKAETFGNDFYWGASISAAQTESASSTDGKGSSIWDEFSKLKRGTFFSKHTIRDGHHPEYSADFYYHYKQDIDLLKAMGFAHFRFSIAWSRILPDGENINQQGLDFYRDIIDYCLESGITPWVTLYHWDLPAALEKKGGWTNRDILKWFELYATICVTNFSKVKNWMILNEPSVFVGAGYFFGIHAPGKKGFPNFFKALHHATLSIHHLYNVIKNINPELNVGSTFSFTHIDSADEHPLNLKAANIADLLINRLFFEPVIGLGYPKEQLKILHQIEKHMMKGDELLMKTELDFIGIQTYTREVFRYNRFNPFLKIKQIEPRERTTDLTAMNWEVYPESIYHILKKIDAYGTRTPLIITENGIALNDQLENGSVKDLTRIQYFQDHIAQVKKAKDEGVNLKGYFAWSLMDNFEWAEGYHPRFGLVHIDFETKERTMKESGHWFRGFLGKE